jgi:hypothetical protein
MQICYLSFQSFYSARIQAIYWGVRLIGAVNLVSRECSLDAHDASIGEHFVVALEFGKLIALALWWSSEKRCDGLGANGCRYAFATNS